MLKICVIMQPDTVCLCFLPFQFCYFIVCPLPYLSLFLPHVLSYLPLARVSPNMQKALYIAHLKNDFLKIF